MHSTALGFACVLSCGIGITPLLVEMGPFAHTQTEAPSTVAGASGVQRSCGLRAYERATGLGLPPTAFRWW